MDDTTASEGAHVLLQAGRLVAILYNDQGELPKVLIRADAQHPLVDRINVALW